MSKFKKKYCEQNLKKSCSQHLLGGGVVLDELAVLHGVAGAHPVDLLVHLSPGGGGGGGGAGGGEGREQVGWR